MLPRRVIVAVRVAKCGFAYTVSDCLPRLRLDVALRRGFGERVEVVHEQGDHGMPGMLRFKVPRKRGGAPPRPERCSLSFGSNDSSIAEELVKPGHAPLQIADGDTSKQINVHFLPRKGRPRIASGLIVELPERQTSGRLRSPRADRQPGQTRFLRQSPGGISSSPVAVPVTDIDELRSTFISIERTRTLRGSGWPQRTLSAVDTTVRTDEAGRSRCDTARMTAQDPADLIGSLAEAYVNSRCLHVAANLGVADILTDEPRTLVAVASELDVEPTALVRLLRHLASLGVFAMREDNVWNNEASRLLRTGHPDELLPLTRMLGLPIMWDSFGALDQAVRTGRPGATFRDPEGFFAYLDAHPAESAVYDEGMAAMTTRRIARSFRTTTSLLSTSSPISAAAGDISCELSWTVPRRLEVCCSTENRF